MKPTIKTCSNKQFNSIRKAMDKQWHCRATTELELLTDIASQFAKRSWIKAVRFHVGNKQNPKMYLLLITISDQTFKITYEIGSDNTISNSELNNITKERTN